jgi:hypothetical protein
MFFGKKKTPGMVYLGESTRRDGSKKIYTGMTRRPVQKRWGEHINSTKSTNSRTWVGKGEGFKPIGAFFSRNPEKAEKTIKSLKPYQKKYLARGAAMKYKKKQSYW